MELAVDRVSSILFKLGYVLSVVEKEEFYSFVSINLIFSHRFAISL